jgi:kynurenine formamidase
MSHFVVEHGGRRFSGDLQDALSLAIPLDFTGPQPNHFGAPPATANALTDGNWVGDVRVGGTVNCEQIALVPHCNGTHTECVGHLTTDRVPVHGVLKGGLYLTQLITVRPVRRADTRDEVDIAARSDEWVICADAIETALLRLPGSAEALAVRTLPNDGEKLTHVYTGEAPAPFFTRTAAERIVARGIQHLVVDLPSIDRAHDAGRMDAHRTFWGLPAGGCRYEQATRPYATITELAWIAPTIGDGWYLLDLQIPAFLSDAAPCRPLLYPLRAT